MPDSTKPHTKGLTPAQASAAMQAARLNAVDLMDTAELLFSHKRFGHSVAVSTLAIEEAGKLPILQLIFLGFAGDLGKSWKAYRQHRAKTANLNLGIQGRIRATFPEIPLAAAQDIAARGPTPGDLETNKQLALYSDCLEVAADFVCHLPRNVDWRQQARDRLCEAQALVHGLRDYPPEELEVWLNHAEQARAGGGAMSSMLEALHSELLAKGFVKEGWWTILLQDLAAEDEGA